MANSSEIILITATCSVCNKILTHIQNKCKTLEDAERFVGKMLTDAEKLAQKKGLPISPTEL